MESLVIQHIPYFPMLFRCKYESIRTNVFVYSETTAETIEKNVNKIENKCGVQER
jgi:hypothetical protein